MPFRRDRAVKRRPHVEHANKNGLRKKVYAIDGSHYEGEWKNDMKHGKGTELLRNGWQYEGDWKFGRKNGYGVLSKRLKNGTFGRKYVGQWKDDNFHGSGLMIYSPNEFYEGEFRFHQRHGWGKMTFSNGDIYEGEWKNDKQHGRGLLEFANGNWFEGHFQYGVRHGEGKYYFHRTGQLMRGLWITGIGKMGTMQDLDREEASHPTQFPIPECELKDPESVVNIDEELLKRG